MIKLIKSTFYKELQTKKRLIKFLSRADWLSFGKQCLKFEENFAKYQGRKHCVFLNSGSSANLAIIQALLNMGELKRGDNIGFSALTWSTNVMPLIELGLNPIPIDVELETLNVSSTNFLKVLKNYRLRGLFITNLLGFVNDIDVIADICKSENIVMIEDNCEALGTIYKGKKLGNYGLTSTFSFYVGHHLSTIEGGAVCTDNEKLATMLRLVRAHGWDRNLSLKTQNKIRNKHKVNSTFYSRYTFYDLGFNLRPTEITGFLGNEQLKYIDEIIKKREKNFKYLAVPIYKQESKYYPIKYDHIDLLSNFAVPVVCKNENTRRELVRKCKNKVEIRPVVGGDMTKQPFFKKYINKNTKLMKNSNSGIIHKQGLYFGNNPEMTNSEMKRILEIFT